MSTPISTPCPAGQAVFGLLRTRFTSAQCLKHFLRLLNQTALMVVLSREAEGFYDRLFSPTITLWYLIFQRLNPDHALQAVVVDAHSGGADGLKRRGRRPLSQRIRSLATTAYSNARQRFPCSALTQGLAVQAQQIWQGTQGWGWRGLRVILLDGSTVRLRPSADIALHFPGPGNQHGKGYWCLMRVVVGLCAQSGVAVANAVAAMTTSEQTLACQLLLQTGRGCLYLGDRNFGIFRIAQTAREADTHLLVRLTQSRADKLLGQKKRSTRIDTRVCWSPSRHDQLQPGCSTQPVEGRLIVAQIHRRGFRSIGLCLFTTLLDTEVYPASALLELYPVRWQVELNLRYLKDQMDLKSLDCQSAAMAEKEWLAGLMAYNLIRAIMVAAATQHQLPIHTLSFSATRRCLLAWWCRGNGIKKPSQETWQTLLKWVSQCRQPRRKKPRPSEPRAKRYVRETFPPLCGDRRLARKQIAKNTPKN